MKVGNFFLEIRGKIETAKKTRSNYVLELGEKREAMVSDALEELKGDRLIKAFIKTINLSWSDVVKGVDFYVIYITDKHRVCPLSVSGRSWVEFKKRQHPENQCISVDLEEEISSIKNKIIRAIAAQERKWKS